MPASMIPTLTGPSEIVFAFDQVPLPDGDYAVTVCATSRDALFIYDWHEQRYRFEVRDPSRTTVSLDFPVHIRLAQSGSDLAVGR